MTRECSCGADDEPRPHLTIPPAILQVIGLACLLGAVWAIYDGWYILGALGVALLAGRLDSVPHAVRDTAAMIRRARSR